MTRNESCAQMCNYTGRCYLSCDFRFNFPFTPFILEAQSLREQTNPPRLQIKFLFSVEALSKPFISVSASTAHSFMNSFQN